MTYSNISITFAFFEINLTRHSQMNKSPKEFFDKNLFDDKNHFIILFFHHDFPQSNSSLFVNSINTISISFFMLIWDI